MGDAYVRELRAELDEARASLARVEALAAYLDGDGEPSSSYANGKRVSAQMLRAAMRGDVEP